MSWNAIDKFISKAFRENIYNICSISWNNICRNVISSPLKPLSPVARLYFHCSRAVGPKERYEIPRNAFSNLDRFLRSDRQPKRASQRQIQRYRDTRTHRYYHYTRPKRGQQRSGSLYVCVCVLMMLAAAVLVAVVGVVGGSGYWMNAAAAAAAANI